LVNLLSGLKPEGKYNSFIGHGETSEDEDEDANEIVERRMSMNQANAVGMNF